MCSEFYPVQLSDKLIQVGSLRLLPLPGVHVAGAAPFDGSVDDEGVVDVDEEGELGAVRERRDVGALQLHRQLLVGLRSLKRAIG